VIPRAVEGEPCDRSGSSQAYGPAATLRRERLRPDPLADPGASQSQSWPEGPGLSTSTQLRGAALDQR
jgi:hypothetical protein